ncbi:MAG: acyltransferase family protein [Bacteroidaceae bacterium]|nr:acyltransferase family protein [Bacteroidaceae bacterium]
MSRDDSIDCIKGFLIFLVVFGHFVIIGLTTFDNKAIYSFIYLFHMPLFVFISGLLTKRKEKEAFKQGWFGLFETFMAFSVYYSVLLYGMFDVSISYLLTPVWILWYLCSLLTYRFFFHFIDIHKYNPLLVVFLSFVVAIISGFVPFVDEKFAFNRTCTFLPFFVLGLYAQKYKEIIKRVDNVPTIVCFLVLALIYYLCEKHEGFFLMMVESDGHNYYLNYADVNTLLYMRIIYLLVAFIASICVLRLIPKLEVLSKCGKNSLNIYLYHAFPCWYLGKITCHYNYSIRFVSVVVISIITIYLINCFSDNKVSGFLLKPYTWIKSRRNNNNY